jgi:hypothetical protein
LSKDTSSLSGGLLNLAEKLPQMCLNSRVDSTRRCYKNAFEKWCKWCVSVKLPSFPATEFHVSLYLIHLSDLRKSVSSIKEAFYKKNPSIFHIEKWLKIVLTNEKLIKIIHSIFKLAR